MELIADSTAVHAVRRGADGLLAANFWRAGTARELSCDGPASVLVRPKGRNVGVALSDPTQLRSTVVVELAGRGLTLASGGPRVSAARTPGGIRITADTSGLRGTTLDLTLKRS